MVDYQNSWVADLSSFDDDDVIPAIYPRNPYDDEGADNIFGLGSKKKKAEKKLRKAEKQLAKGHIAKAEKKIAKAAKKLGEPELLKGTIQSQIASIKAGTNVAPPPTAINESLNTDAGQIGSQGGTPTQYSQPTYSGGGGDMSMDTGYTPETNLATPTAEDNTGGSDEPTGDLAQVKDLEGVTVTAGKKNNTMMFIIIGALVLLAIWYFSKKGKLKTLK